MKNFFLIAFFGCIVMPQPFNAALAESGWIVDTANGCTFFNPNPQPNESIKFEGICTKKNAKGKLTWFENEQVNEIAEGQWVDGKQTGKGTYQYIKSGNLFQGTYVDGKAVGKGTFTWANGNSYVGDYVGGKRTGKGTYKWVNGASYVGDFVAGKRTGKGVLVSTDENGSLKYKGDFLNDRFHGFGELNFSFGLKYVGQFADGDWSGRGVMYLSGGRKFEGNFSNNVAIGDGVLTLENGQRIQGRHEDGRFVANEENLDHQTCVKLGFSANTPDYAVCRTQVEMAKRRAQDDERAYRSQLLEQQRNYEEQRKEAALLRGLTALGAAANILQPPPPIQSPMHTYTMPGGRSVTCSTFGSFTNCN